MGIISKLLGRKTERAEPVRIEPEASVVWGGTSWDDYVRAGADSVGVNEQTARAVAAVAACVNLIGGSIASMPLHTYRRTADGEREAYKSDLWWLLNERPFGAWSAAAFWEFLAASRLFHGDAFARIHRVGQYQPGISGFEPLHPDRVQVKRVAGRLRYTIQPLEAQEQAVTIDQDDMLHVPGPGFNGLRSVSQLQHGLRSAAGIAEAADRQAGALMADGLRSDFAIEVPGSMKGEQIDSLRRTFLERNRGQSTSRAPVVMTNGMKLHQLTLTSQDAELLATRGFQIEEICRAMGVPPFMVGHTEKTTSWGSGIEQMSIGFVKYTLQRHLVAIEQELNFKLFKTSRNFCEFVTAGLERGDIKARYEAYRIALGRAGESSWIDASEIRRLENLPPNEKFNNQPAAPQPTAP